MADMNAACVLKHRRLLMCRRGTLGTDIATKLSQGTNVDCEEFKMKVVDMLLGIVCRYNADATLNCLTNDETCDVIQQCYRLLPEDC